MTLRAASALRVESGGMVGAARPFDVRSARAVGRSDEVAPGASEAMRGRTVDTTPTAGGDAGDGTAAGWCGSGRSRRRGRAGRNGQDAWPLPRPDRLDAAPQ